MKAIVGGVLGALLGFYLGNLGYRFGSPEYIVVMAFFALAILYGAWCAS